MIRYIFSIDTVTIAVEDDVGDGPDYCDHVEYPRLSRIHQSISNSQVPTQDDDTQMQQVMFSTKDVLWHHQDRQQQVSDNHRANEVFGRKMQFSVSMNISMTSEFRGNKYNKYCLSFMI